MSILFIGVDNGNFQQKTSNFVFSTGVIESDVPQAIADETILFNGKYYSLTHSRETYMDNKAQNTKTFALTLFGIAKEIKHRIKQGKVAPANKYKIALGVGLPPGHYNRLKDTYRNYFTSFGNNLTFTYNDEVFNIEIVTVGVYLQGHAASAAAPSLLRKYSTTYIVDIGGYTTDVMKMVKGLPDISDIRSEEMGMIHLFNDIKKYVMERMGLSLSELNISDVLEKRPNTIPDEVVNHIHAACDEYLHKVLTNLQEKHIDLRLTPAIFVGGGSVVLKDAISRSPLVGTCEFVDTIHANAIGYENILELTMKTKKGWWSMAKSRNSSNKDVSRFSIFISKDSEEEAGVYEILKHNGRRKSELISKALAYYLVRNPQEFEGVYKTISMDIGGVLLEQRVPLSEDPTVLAWLSRAQAQLYEELQAQAALISMVQLQQMQNPMMQMAPMQGMPMAPAGQATMPQQASAGQPAPSPTPVAQQPAQEIVATEASHGVDGIDDEDADLLLAGLAMFG